MENQKVIIISNGRTTDIMVNGRLYGDGVVKVEFVHDHKDKLNNARLLIMTEQIPLEGSVSSDEKQKFMRKIEEFSKEEKMISENKLGPIVTAE